MVNDSLQFFGLGCHGILMTVVIGMAYRRNSSKNSDGSGSRLDSDDMALTQVQGPPRQR
jgi:hypothetical protein